MQGWGRVVSLHSRCGDPRRRWPPPATGGEKTGLQWGPPGAHLSHPVHPAHTHLSAGQADDPLTPIQVLAAVTCAERDRVSAHLPQRPPPGSVALTKDAGELGHAGHEALEVHTQPAVPVAAGEGLGQLVVQVEA